MNSTRNAIIAAMILLSLLTAYGFAVPVRGRYQITTSRTATGSDILHRLDTLSGEVRAYVLVPTSEANRLRYSEIGVLEP